VGDDDGATFFLPPGMSMEDKASKGESRPFDKLKDLINFVLETPDGEGKATEVEAAKAYCAKMDELEKNDLGEQLQRQESLKEKKDKDKNKSNKPRRGPGRPRPRGRPPGSASRLLDHTGSTWKNTRKHYPKIISRVGPEFQVSVIPNIRLDKGENSFDSDDETPQYSLMWSSDEANEKLGFETLSKFMEHDVPANKREAAMAMIHVSISCEMCFSFCHFCLSFYSFISPILIYLPLWQ